jgi:tetratricopeptide (TPR) repeat protein
MSTGNEMPTLLFGKSDRSRMNIESGSRPTGVALSFFAMALLLSGCVRSPEARSATYLEAGKKLLAKNDPNRAILQFRNAVQTTPKNAEAYYQLSIADLTNGDLPNGVASLRKALELNPKHRPAQLRMAQLMAMASDPALVKEAQERLQKMLQEGPDEGDAADALHALAFAELKLDETEDAIRNLGRAMVLAPQDLLLAESMAEAKLKQKDTKGGEEVLKKASQDSPKSAEAAFFLGRFYGSQNRWPEAEQQFNRALSLDNHNADALYNLAALQNRTGRKQEAEQNFKRLAALPGKTFKPIHATFLFEEGRRDEAIREFEALAKADPDDRDARTRLIAAYRAVQRQADAEKVLNAALKRNPKDSDALLQRGEMFVAAGNYGRAETDLNQVIRLNPDSAQAHYVMAKFHQKRGEKLTYRQELMKALQLDEGLAAVRIEAARDLVASGDAKAALTLLDQAPGSQKTLTPMLVQRNWVLWAMGDMAEMRKGIDLGLSRGPSTDLLLQDGVWKLRAGKFPAARVSLDQALNIDPGDVRALGALNQAYRAEKQDATALQKMKEYASRKPDSAPVQEFLGVLLTAQGQRKQARAAFDAARVADPKFVRADLSLVQLDVVDGKIDDAEHRLQAILDSDRTNATARLWLGNVEVTKGNRKAALENYRQVVAADPANAQGLNNYAYLLAESGGQLTEALKYAQKAKELSPLEAEYSDTLGWILYREGLYRTAVSELERAVAVKGNNVISKYHLAMAYAKAGDLNRGRTTLNAALKLNPSVPEAKLAEAVMGSAQ